MNSAAEFLSQKDKFQLGDLPTESPHPKTTELSEWALNDLPRALKVLREVDLAALEKIVSLKEELRPIFEVVSETLSQGDRIFLVGCGATGRLSLSLEYLWRKKHLNSEQVFSLMAGGDVALVHSLEGFEDFPEYGARHLLQMGFKDNDLLIGSTEGGETPYVIGAVEEAAKKSKRLPLFLYCNSKEILVDKVERSRRVLANPKIQSFCLSTGPMALTGSTRMQASTVLMLVIGLALEYGRDQAKAWQEMNLWIEFLRKQDCSTLKSLIERESGIYQEGQHTIYSSDDYAITMFTDTTERAPTFNLAPFDNPQYMTDRHSLTYVTLPSAKTALEAWQQLLAREPRPLEWSEIHTKTTGAYLLSFDFGKNAVAFRNKILPDRTHHIFDIRAEGPLLKLRLLDHTLTFERPGKVSLFDHLSLKMLLNMHSTLVMGRLGRFEGNLMTWVFPSNGKLVDRAARYTQILLKKKGMDRFSYDEIVRAQYESKNELSPKESIVHKTIQKLMKT